MADDYYERIAGQFLPTFGVLRGLRTQAQEREKERRRREHPITSEETTMVPAEPEAPVERAFREASQLPEQLGRGLFEVGERALGAARELFDPYTDVARSAEASAERKANEQAMARQAAEAALMKERTRQAVGGVQPGEESRATATAGPEASEAGFISVGGQRFSVRKYQEPKAGEQPFSWAAGAQPKATFIAPSETMTGPVIAGETAPRSLEERRAQSRRVLAPHAFRGSSAPRGVPSWSEVQGAGYRDLPSYLTAQAQMGAAQEMAQMAPEQARMQMEEEASLSPLRRSAAEAELRRAATITPLVTEAERQKLTTPQPPSGQMIGLDIVNQIAGRATRLYQEADAAAKAGNAAEAARLRGQAESERRRAEEYAIAISTGVQLKGQDPLAAMMALSPPAPK